MALGRGATILCDEQQQSRHGAAEPLPALCHRGGAQCGEAMMTDLRCPQTPWRENTSIAFTHIVNATDVRVRNLSCIPHFGMLPGAKPWVCDGLRGVARACSCAISEEMDMVGDTLNETPHFRQTSIESIFGVPQAGQEVTRVTPQHKTGVRRFCTESPCV